MANETQTILIVDDEPAMRKAMMQTLHLRGYRVLAYPEGQLCLDALVEESCDLVVSDVSMPGMDGLSLLKKIKEKYPNMPVLMVSGYADIATAVECVKQGAFDFLEKPFDEDTLLPKIEAGLEISKPCESNPLSEIEQRILKLVAQGKTNKEIAFDVDKSQRTVENQRQKIIKKLGAYNAAEAVTVALRMKYI